MKKVLMILTSHRLDCLRLCVDLLVAADSLRHFDVVVFLENGITPPHRRFIERFIREHPKTAWDRVSGPRGRGERISNLQNECVRRHPGALYFKIDEDTFVAPGWIEKMLDAYRHHQEDPRLSLITPVIPNNSAGAFFLLHAYPELGSDYDATFQQPRTPYVNGPVSAFPQVGEWLTRKFLALKEANARLTTMTERLVGQGMKLPATTAPDTGQSFSFDGAPPYLHFGFRFSINCICYDYRHWQEIHGVPTQDEIGWGDWIVENHKYVVLVTNILVHHYSFFVQQNWLDRTSLLEDLRAANLPDTMSRKKIIRYHLPRWQRVAKQVPGALKRRLHLGE
jgi:hypothetical protein